MNAAKKIVVMDDSDTVRKMLAAILEDAGHQVFTCEFWDDARRLLGEHAPDALILDVNMPYAQGDSIAYVVKRTFPGVVVLYYSGADEEQLRALTAATGADGYVRKSEDFDGLLAALATHLGDGRAGTAR